MKWTSEREARSCRTASYNWRRRALVDSPLERATQMPVLRTSLSRTARLFRESLTLRSRRWCRSKVVARPKMALSTALAGRSANTCDLGHRRHLSAPGFGMDVLRILNERKHWQSGSCSRITPRRTSAAGCAARAPAGYSINRSEIDELGPSTACSLQTGPATTPSGAERRSRHTG